AVTMSTARVGGAMEQTERAQQFESRSSRIGPPVFRVAAILAWCYLVIALFYGAQIGPIKMGTVITVLVLLGGSVAISRAVRAVCRRRTPLSWLLDAGIVMLGLLVVIVAADVLFTM